MKIQFLKRMFACALAIVLMLPMHSQLTVFAEEYFYINGKSYSKSTINSFGYSDCSSFCAESVAEGNGHICCVRKCKEAYYKFWGQSIGAMSRDDLLYGYTSMAINTENVKKCLNAAEPGAIMFYARSWQHDWGHAVVFLKLSSDGSGAWILNCNYDAKGNCKVGASLLH